MDFEYKYEPRHLAFIKEQIWECKDDISVYSKLSAFEHEQIEKYLPKNPKIILEMGCGLGRGSISLNNYYKDNKISYILADRHGFTDNSGAFSPENDEFYNDLWLTEDFCKVNGIKKVKTFDTEVDDWESLPKNIDLIISRCSLGMHVPIERYMDKLLKLAGDNCTMIFGTRHSSYSDESFKESFKEVVFDFQGHRPPFPHQNWLVLKGKL